MTCNGAGFIPTPRHTEASTALTDVCPVCNGSKTQTVHETDSGKLFQVALQDGSISLTDAFKLIQ